MERHAHYALVGVVSVALVIAAMAFVAWLGKAGFTREFDPYRVEFRGPVRGISEGTEVQFNGIRVGQIERIGLDAADASRVMIDIKVKAGTPVRTDSYAMTEPLGISGYNIIQIDAGSQGARLLRDVSKDERPIIRSKRDRLSALVRGGGELLAKAVDTLDRIDRILSDDTIANLGAAVRDVRLTTQALAEHRAVFAQASAALVRVEGAAGAIEQAAQSVHGMADGDGKRTLGEILATVQDLRATIGDARRTLAKLDTQADSMGANTMPTLNATMLSVQDTAQTLDGLIRDLRRDPQGMLGKRRGRQLELRP